MSLPLHSGRARGCNEGYVAAAWPLRRAATDQASPDAPQTSGEGRTRQLETVVQSGLAELQAGRQDMQLAPAGSDARMGRGPRLEGGVAGAAVERLGQVGDRRRLAQQRGVLGEVLAHAAVSAALDAGPHEAADAGEVHQGRLYLQLRRAWRPARSDPARDGPRRRASTRAAWRWAYLRRHAQQGAALGTSSWPLRLKCCTGIAMPETGLPRTMRLLFVAVVLLSTSRYGVAGATGATPGAGDGAEGLAVGGGGEHAGLHHVAAPRHSLHHPLQLLRLVLQRSVHQACESVRPLFCRRAEGTECALAQPRPLTLSQQWRTHFPTPATTYNAASDNAGSHKLYGTSVEKRLQ